MATKGRKRKRRTADYRPPPRKTASGPKLEGTAGGDSPPAARRGTRDRPPAPWGSFPLVELVVLLALIMLIAGFFVSGTRGITMIAAGVTLASLAGLELSIRAHFAGDRA